MKCFVIMPFTESFDPVFDVVRDVACDINLDADIQCEWLKDVHAAGRITREMAQYFKDQGVSTLLAFI